MSYCLSVRMFVFLLNAAEALYENSELPLHAQAHSITEIIRIQMHALCMPSAIKSCVRVAAGAAMYACDIILRLTNGKPKVSAVSAIYDTS